MSKISTIVGHFLAWTPLALTILVFLFFRFFTGTDFGLAAILLNQYVAPIVVGAAAAVICLGIYLLRFLFNKTYEEKWYDLVGICLHSLIIVTSCVGFGLLMEA